METTPSPMTPLLVTCSKTGDEGNSQSTSLTKVLGPTTNQVIQSPQEIVAMAAGSQPQQMIDVLNPDRTITLLTSLGQPHATNVHVIGNGALKSISTIAAAQMVSGSPGNITYNATPCQQIHNTRIEDKAICIPAELPQTFQLAGKYIFTPTGQTFLQPRGVQVPTSVQNGGQALLHGMTQIGGQNLTIRQGNVVHTLKSPMPVQQSFPMQEPISSVNGQSVLQTVHVPVQTNQSVPRAGILHDQRQPITVNVPAHMVPQLSIIGHTAPPQIYENSMSGMSHQNGVPSQLVSPISDYQHSYSTPVSPYQIPQSTTWVHTSPQYIVQPSLAHVSIGSAGTMADSCGIAELTETIEKVNAELIQSHTKISELNAKVREQEECLSAAQTEMSNLREENAQAQTEMSNLREENAQVQTEMSNLQEENVQAQTEMSNLREQNAQTQTEMSNLREQNTQAQTEIINLREQNAQAQTEMINLREENAQSQTEMSNLREKNAQSQTEMNNLREQNTQAQTEIINLREQNAQVQTEMSNLREQNTQAQTEIINLREQNAQAQTEMINLREENAQSQTEMSNLGEQNAQSQTEMNNLREQNTQAQTEIINLREQNAQAQTEMINLREENAQAQTEMSNLREQNAQSQTEMINLREQNAQAQTEMNNLREQNARSQTKMNNLREQNTQAQTEIINLREQNAQAQTEMINLREENAQSQTEMSNLREQNAQSQTEIINLREQNAQAQTEMNNLREENAKVQTEMNNLREENAQALTEIINLREQNTQAQAEMINLREENAQLASRLKEISFPFVEKDGNSGVVKYDSNIKHLLKRKKPDEETKENNVKTIKLTSILKDGSETMKKLKLSKTKEKSCLSNPHLICNKEVVIQLERLNDSTVAEMTAWGSALPPEQTKKKLKLSKKKEKSCPSNSHLICNKEVVIPFERLNDSTVAEMTACRSALPPEQTKKKFKLSKNKEKSRPSNTHLICNKEVVIPCERLNDSTVAEMTACGSALPPEKVNESNDDAVGINSLPDEIIEEIFGYFTQNQLGQIASRSENSSKEDFSTKEPLCTDREEKAIIREIVSLNHFHHDDLPNNTKGKTFACEICSKVFSVFSNLNNIKKHLVIHTGENPFTCEMCSKGFSQMKYLKQHLRSHLREKTFICDLCSKEFTSSDCLKKHTCTHAGENPYVCEVCSRRFSEKRNLNVHLRTHTGEKPFICVVCSKGFVKNSDLSRHLRTHTGEKPYICEVCSKGFSQKSNLNVHLHKHTGEKPFVCEVCSQGFSQKSNLNVHLHKHTGEKPFVCEVCSQEFSQKTLLNRHSHAHTDENTYFCKICSKRFSDNSALKTHLENHA